MNFPNEETTGLWNFCLQVYQILGFSVAFQSSFQGDYAEESEVVLYYNGFLVYMDSYTDELGVKSVNTSILYGEIEYDESLAKLFENRWLTRTESGNLKVKGYHPNFHFEKLCVLLRRSKPINPWTEPHDSLFLVNYNEADNEIEELLEGKSVKDLKKADSMINSINKEKIGKFSIEEAKEMIGIGRKRKKYKRQEI